MIITNKMTPELINDISYEAYPNLKNVQPELFNNPKAFINKYLQDTYSIYIKRHTNKGETTYTNTLAFYSQCPDYKRIRRRDFLLNYGHHFNGLVLPIKLLRALIKEHDGDTYYMSRVCRQNKAHYIIRPVAGCQALIFNDKARYQLFKLKYSEYL